MSPSPISSPQHHFSRILSDCLSIIFSYHIQLTSHNYTHYSENDLLFFRKFVLCWHFDEQEQINVKTFLEQTRGRKLKLQYVSARFNLSLDNETFKFFRGIRELDVECSPLAYLRAGRHYGNAHGNFTDEALENLRGIETLSMSNCKSVTSAAFVNLRGIKNLIISNMSQLDDFALEQLRGIQRLDISMCSGFTDAGLANLRGIKRLNINLCSQLTDSCFENLRGVQELRMSLCPRVTSAALVNLRGIKVLNMSGCNQTDGKYLQNLIGVRELDISSDKHDSPISDDDLKYLVGVKRLILTGNNRIIGPGLQYVRGVHEIDLSYTDVIKGTYLEALREARVVKMTLPGTEQIFCNLRCVKSLALYRTEIREDAAFANLANVEELSLIHSNLRGLTDGAFVHLRGLKKLAIEHCSGGQFTKRMLENLPRSLDKLLLVATSTIELRKEDTDDVARWLSHVSHLNALMPGQDEIWFSVIAKWKEARRSLNEG